MVRVADFLGFYALGGSMTQATDIAALRALAGKATPGPYSVSGVRGKLGGQPMLQVLWPDGRAHAYIPYSDLTARDHVASHADANFTAAVSPEVITSLLDQIDAMERVVKAARALSASHKRMVGPDWSYDVSVYTDFGKLQEALASLPATTEDSEP